MKKQTRLWLALLCFGLIGQLAWTVENMYFNTFVYYGLSGTVDTIAAMVALSAITATVTTLLMGALSDKLGKRKIFICLGYFIWGLTVIMFAFLNLENVARIFKAAQPIAFAGTLAVIMDCVMTFFGSTSNDACFNAWITDNVTSKERGKFETVIATLPLISMLIIFGLLDSLTQQGKWSTFFIIIGSLVSLGGAAGFFFIDDENTHKSTNSFFKDIVYGFKPSIIKENKQLYVSFILLLVLSISTQVFMPYMIIYIQSYLGITDYAIVLGVVLIVASIISVLAGKVIDMAGADKFFKPSVILLVVGLLLMAVVRTTVPLIISGIIMMSGNLIVTAIINGNIRNCTPEEKAGGFQGIRMIFGVMLPMIIGPYIGAAVIKSSNQTYVDLGTVKQVPTPAIWVAAAVVAALLLLCYKWLQTVRREDNNKHYNLMTEYGKQLDTDNVLPEYPRPQFVRNSYINLNGYWDYAINRLETLPDKYDGQILVPFPLESQLSQVEKQLSPKDILWYRHHFSLTEGFNQGRVVINFGAVDQICKVYINGKLVKEHTGGYLPFSADITDYLKEDNELIVYVKDYSDTSYYSRGKQSTDRGGIWYTPVSGIWQTVWLESYPAQHIEAVKTDIDYDNQTVKFHIDGSEESYHLIIKEKDKVIYEGTVEADCQIKIDNMISWSPENPFLYDFFIDNSKDFIQSYFGMRKFSVGKDDKGYKRLMLNNKPYFHKGVLDQGYWSDGIYTPASYQAYLDDVIMLKEMGFNTIRKHIKIEPQMFYYYCDKYGMLLWQDMVSGGTKYSFLCTAALPFADIHIKDNHYGLFARKQQQSKDMYKNELIETVHLLYNCVSLAMWVPFNEGWGQFDALENEKLLRSLDNTRTVDHASGWHDQGGGDLCSRHIYFNEIKFKKDERVIALTEYGGYNQPIQGHTYNDANYGYKGYQDKEALQNAFKQLHDTQIIPLIENGLSAIIYTQTSDVEDEVNGLITYDRQVEKFDRSFVKEIMDRIDY